MKRWKLFIILSVNSLLLLAPVRIATGCGPQLFFDGYSFLSPGLVDESSSYAPYFYGFKDFYEHFEKTKQIQIDANLEEWNNIFCDQIKIKAIGDLIYNASLSELKLLKTAVKNKKYPISNRLKTNTFARHLKANQCEDTANYLAFAKACEPHVSYIDPWDQLSRDTSRMQELIEEGIKDFRKTKSNYIKLRYAYQIIRLAHYKKNYRQTLELYEYLIPKFDPVESIINYWIMGHRAGAMKSLGQRVEAAYLFSIIFEKCPSKRESAYRSFSIKSDKEWKELLLLCQDDHERSSVYAIRASNNSNRAAEDMEKIYELYPQNPELELLLVKEIKKLEKDLLGLEFNDHLRQNKKLFGYPRKERGYYVIELQKLVKRCVEENKVRHPELWMIADGYLEFLAGDLYAADLTFSKIKDKITNEVLVEQLEVFQLALKINRLRKVNQETEEIAAQIILREPLYKKYNDFPDFLNDRLSFLYKEQGNPGKAFRVKHPIEDLKYNPQLEIIDDLLAVCRKEKEDLSKYEIALITEKDGTTIESELLDMKGTYYMARGKLETALEILKRIPRNDWNKQLFNPFIERTDPCVHCALPDSSETLNKIDVIQKIFELEYKAKADFENNSIHFYELGQAYYNMSYFGHSWKVMDYFRSGSNWSYDKNEIYPHFGAPFGNRENHDLTLALEYFEKARAKSNDPELGAKAAYMAAQCELNMFFVTKGNSYNSYRNEIPEIPPAYRRYYQLLNELYYDTAFYEEIIDECKFFAAYAR